MAERETSETEDEEKAMIEDAIYEETVGVAEEAEAPEVEAMCHQAAENMARIYELLATQGTDSSATTPRGGAEVRTEKIKPDGRCGLRAVLLFSRGEERFAQSSDADILSAIGKARRAAASKVYEVRPRRCLPRGIRDPPVRL